VKKRILILIIGATLLDGILAGGDIDRWVVGMPAWHTVGVVAWANYSRSADLGNGFILYPALAIGGTLLSLAAAASFALQRKQERLVALAVYTAAALSVLGLLLTFKAAPFMLSLRRIQNADQPLLQQAFAGFEFWGGLRVVLQTMAFGANLWSIVAFLQKYKLKE
jgi:hypothetical protein